MPIQCQWRRRGEWGGYRNQFYLPKRLLNIETISDKCIFCVSVYIYKYIAKTNNRPKINKQRKWLFGLHLIPLESVVRYWLGYPAPLSVCFFFVFTLRIIALKSFLHSSNYNTLFFDSHRPIKNCGKKLGMFFFVDYHFSLSTHCTAPINSIWMNEILRMINWKFAFVKAKEKNRRAPEQI